MASESADPSNVRQNHHIHNADENTPLLLAPGSVPDERTNGHAPESNAKDNGSITIPSTTDSPTPAAEVTIPLRQVLLLCFCALADPVAYFAIFPFINEMLHLIGAVPETDVGFWAGMIESLFSLVQMVLMIFYGRAADRLGRKPVLVFSLAGVGISTALFGLSQKLWVMIVLRCVGGMFGGSVVTVRTMLGELTTKETQGRVFSWYMFTRNMGILVGPLIGGGLANPSKEFPGIFGGIPFFERYPYALATFVASAVIMASAISTFFFVDETLKPKVAAGEADHEPPMTTWQVIKTPGVAMVLFLSGHISLLALVYTAVSPTFQYTSVKLGGFGFSDQQIALLVMDAGTFQSIWTLLAFPRLQKKYGTGTVMRVASIGWPFFMIMYPLCNELLRYEYETAFWIIVPVGVAVGSGVAMMFAGNQLCINDISPSREVLGTLNALVLSIGSGVRAFAPVLGNSIFAFGVKWGWADGHLVWFVIVFLALILIVACWYIPEAAEGRPEKRKQTTEVVDD